MYQLIPPGGTFVLPCAFGGWDVFVWLKKINFVDVTNGGSNVNSVSSFCIWSGWGLSYTGACPTSGCGPATYSMVWTPTQVVIK